MWGRGESEEGVLSERWIKDEERYVSMGEQVLTPPT
jgi:hypothetical protein